MNKMNMDIICAQKNETDAKIIYNWRNDPVTRQMSFVQDIHLWKDFQNSYLQFYFSNSIPPLFVTIGNKKIGFLHFRDDKVDRKHIISINVDPEYRNKKLGHKIINKVLDFVKENQYNEFNIIEAHIKAINIPSIKVFEKSGFLFVDEYVSNEELVLKYKYDLHWMRIGNKTISNDHPAFIIAELSCNHKQDFDIATKLIIEAYKAGANAIKLQTYTADTITLNCKKKYFQIEGTLWSDMYLHDLYSQAYTPWEWHKALRDEAHKLGMEFLSSPFDTTAVDFLENLSVPAYKIASFEITDHILIKKIAQTKKPVIISSGMASVDELQEAVNLLRENGCKDICMLKCTSAYPAKPEDANLLTIRDMQKKFNVMVGLSDHTLGIEVPIVSVVLGAKIIEKHFVASRNSETLDEKFSLTPTEFREMVSAVRIAEKSIGQVSYGGVLTEQDSKKLRRSLFICQDIKKGGTFTSENIRSVRPGLGLHTKFYENILGKTASRDLEYGEPLKWDDVLFA